MLTIIKRRAQSSSAAGGRRPIKSLENREREIDNYQYEMCETRIKFYKSYWKAVTRSHGIVAYFVLTGNY